MTSVPVIWSDTASTTSTSYIEAPLPQQSSNLKIEEN